MIHPGAVLNNRYRLDKKIGEGGFAVVFLGQDLVLGRTVAVKLMDASLAGDKELLGRFQLEARAVAALDHPNILTVHDFGLLPDSAFLVMPYIGGGPLSARLRTERLSLEEIGRYLEQISSALDYAHRNGIVHRDVKPQNILLRNDGRAVLTDFGFAKLLVDANAEAQTRALGTVHYVAPEQIRGLVSAATDQYSLGILLYQMISNALPFNGTPQQILIGHVQQPPPSLASQPSMQGYSPEMIQKLDQVLARALAKAASARYPSCMALYNAYMEAIQPAVIYGGVAFEEKTVIDPRVAKSPAQGSQLQSVGQVNPQPQVQAAAPNYNQPVIPSARPVPVPAAPGGNDEATELYVPVIAGPQQQPQPKPVAPVLVQPARLTVRTEPDQHVTLTFDLKEEVMTLGRELDNALQIPLSIVSRHHATLYRVGPVGPGMKYRIVDNKSRNQLSYRGQTITEKVLENGDTIEIGRRGYGEYVVFLTYTAPLFK